MIQTFNKTENEVISVENLFIYRHTFWDTTLRWTLAPFALPILLVLNVVLVAQETSFLYSFTLAMQIFVYGLALLGYLRNRDRVQNKFLLALFYFLMMNYSVWLGALRLIRGKQSAVWDKALRAA